ncbi:alpha/beta hydrolase [Marinobacter salinisoli]|uniref:Alpha/beta hydrolase n=1 Tax=Marinobacter salinisoli TaxID=2769486 RepID=A0ABX7MSB4_9GAMM|nr:alpha/beta hydrolase [Marinobacter salinisoli]QSP94325.1 alpha/beta hydrolase [Marinobacter salinisoli]
MNYKSTVKLLFLVAALLASTISQARTASVNGIHLYYEDVGWGKPLIMLHGGFGDSDMWDPHTALLRFHYRVIKIDSRGHGRSTDIYKDDEAEGGRITYQLMARDVLALMDKLRIDNAHFVGWSDGAVIAADIAATQPHRVDQLMLFGAAFGGNVYNPGFQSLLNSENLFKDFIDLTYRAAYEAKNPKPRWTKFRDGMYKLWTTPCYLVSMNPDNCLEPLGGINSATLVVVGEDEIVSFAHTLDVVNAIPDASLQVVPLAGHFFPETQPLRATAIITNFLD